jgi:phage-related protein
MFIPFFKRGDFLKSTKFVFDGIPSEYMGLNLIRLDSGMFDLPFVPSRNIIEEYPTNAISPYFHKSQLQTQTITMTFSTLEDNMDSEYLAKIAKWLFQNEYKEFYSIDNPDKIYYLIATNEVNFTTNGSNSGYFQIQFKSKFPYALTRQQETNYTINNTKTIQIYNNCNVFEYYYPEIEFTVSSTPASILFCNLSDDSRISNFGGLSVGETLYVNNQKKIISSSTNNYRYDGFNKVWFRLVYGLNRITILGTINLTVRCQFPIFN